MTGYTPRPMREWNPTEHRDRAAELLEKAENVQENWPYFDRLIALANTHLALATAKGIGTARG